MQKMPSFKIVCCAAIVTVMAFSGCKQEDLIHQKSMSELNIKAQQMLQAGDVNGAVSRLEAAHDLSPDEPNTSLNLAIAYQMQGNHDKAIELFQGLLNKPGQDQGELYKNLGITYEAKADALDAKKRELAEDPKADATQLESMKAEATESYQAALQNYEQAISKVKGSDQVQRQIDQIHAKLEHPEGSASQAAVE